MTIPNSELGQHHAMDIEQVERLYTHGATCDTYIVRIYGKLHFLKRLKAELSAQPRYVLAFRKEFETGFALNHPALPRYVALQDEHQRPAIVEEYVEGQTLTAFLGKHPDYFHHQANARKFIRQLLSVFDYLHHRQILFLDLKPDNILLTNIGHDLRLVDFGFCYTPGFNTTTGHTAGFAAPEQLVGAPADERTDIYLMGKVLQLCGVPSRYKKVIGKCLAARPAGRYADVAEMGRAVHWAEKQPSPRTLALCLVVTGTLTALFLLFLSPRRPTQILEPAFKSKAITPTKQNAEPALRLPTHPTARPSTTRTGKEAATEKPAVANEAGKMTAEAHREMDKIYAETLQPLENEETLSAQAFSAPFLEYRRRTEALKQSLSQSYPTLPYTAINEEIDRYTSKIVYPISSKVKVTQ